MKILVTGSSRLIGSSLISYLKDQGIDVFGLSLTPSNAMKLKNIPSTVGNILDKECITSCLKGCDGIIHLAAVSRVSFGEQSQENCRRVNIEGTRNVVEAALASPQKPWILYSSSREVYGPQKIFPVKEDACLAPQNTYAFSKLEGEKIIQQAQEKGLRACILRLSNVYGTPYDYPDRAVPAFIKKALNNETIHCVGAENIIDFTSIKDVVEAIYTAVLRLNAGKTLPPMNIASGKGLSLYQAAQGIIKLLESPSKIIIHPGRSFDVKAYIGSNVCAREYLGWRPKTSFEEGVRNLAEDYKALLSKTISPLKKRMVP